MAPFAKSRHDGRWVWGLRTGTCVTQPLLRRAVMFRRQLSAYENMKGLLGLAASL